MPAVERGTAHLRQRQANERDLPRLEVVRTETEENCRTLSMAQSF